jgi:hypothetical protein
MFHILLSRWKQYRGRAWYLLCLAVFLLTSAVVFRCGGLMPGSSADNLATARSTIWHRLLSAEEANSKTPSAHAAAIRRISQQISSEANVAAVVHASGAWLAAGQDRSPAAFQQAVAEIREMLRVHVGRAGAADEVQIEITCEHREPAWAVALANAFAERYAAEFRAAWWSRAREANSTAQAAAEKSLNDLLLAHAKLSSWLAGQVHKQNVEQVRAQNTASEHQHSTHADTGALAANAPHQALSGAPSQTASKTASPTASQTVPQAASQSPPPAPELNPASVELHKQIAQLQQQKAALMIDRTPLHPAVQAVEARIQDLQHQLRDLPPGVASQAVERPSSQPCPQLFPPSGTEVMEPTKNAGAGVLGSVSPSSPSTETKRAEAPRAGLFNVDEYLALKKEIDAARQTHALALRERERGRQSRREEPPIRLELAHQPESLAVAPIGWRLLEALLAGVGAALLTGATLVWLRKSQQNRLVATVGQLERLMAVPVFGPLSLQGKRDLPLCPQ